jgi:hypothetical protein
MGKLEVAKKVTRFASVSPFHVEDVLARFGTIGAMEQRRSEI